MAFALSFKTVADSTSTLLHLRTAARATRGAGLRWSSNLASIRAARPRYSKERKEQSCVLLSSQGIRAFHLTASSRGETQSREGAERFLHEAREALRGKDDSLDAELLGAFRQGRETVSAIILLVIGKQDFSTPRGPDESNFFQEQEARMIHALQGAGLIQERNGLLFSRLECSVPVKLHYTSMPCAGASKLYFTGDESYIRFLKLFSEDAMGLTLCRYGLWRRVDEAGRAQIEQRLRQATPARGSFQQSVMHEGQRLEPSQAGNAMELERQAMGLPEGLDLSLDLGPSSLKATRDDTSGDLISKHGNKPDIAGAEPLGQQWERVVVGTGSEADILDILGMAWIAPEMRFVREPKNRMAK